MRNGNSNLLRSLAPRLSVLTVPMRNGNSMVRTVEISWSKFLPYLWGMETTKIRYNFGGGKGSYRTYEEWKRCLKVEVPTSSIFGSYRTYEEWKHKSMDEMLNIVQGSYRTYEEWKLHTGEGITELSNRSYRTYEEWKPLNSHLHRQEVRMSSYRTYEEWKPVKCSCGLLPPFSSYRTYEEWKLCFAFF